MMMAMVEFAGDFRRFPTIIAVGVAAAAATGA